MPQAHHSFGTVTGLYPKSINLHHPAKKLQTGTIIPVVFDLYREFAERPVCFDLRAIQPAQTQVDSLYSLHESVLWLLIFCTDYAIL